MREQQLKKKNEERTKQLSEFKQETTTSNDLHSQLLAIDQKTKAKTKVQEIVGLGQDDLQESPEVDRRLERLRQTRKEIDQDEERKQQQQDVYKQQEVEKRIKKLEEIKLKKDQEQKSKQQQDQNQDQGNQQKKAAFLSNIQTFEVEDI